MKKKIVSVLCVLSLVVGLAVGVGAAPILEKISANLNWSINFVIDGKQWAPKDQSGNKIAPITYNNTTYLPVRAVSEALGTAVNFDNKTQTITLGEKSDSVPMTAEEIKTKISTFVTTDKQYTVHGGKDYKSGVLMKEMNVSEKEFTIKTNGKHQTFEMTVLPIEVTEDISVKVFDGEVLLKEIVLSSSDSSQTASFDIGGAKELKITARPIKFINTNDIIFITGSFK